jgi:hypothetical protein
VRETDKKNLAIEALKKLINGEVRSQSRRNVTQSRAFRPGPRGHMVLKGVPATVIDELNGNG